MSDEIGQIRGLLDLLESRIASSPDEVALRDFAALELPEIVADVIDYLTPQLTPYEAAFYFYLFRHSIISAGTQYIRASNPRLRAIAAPPKGNALISEQQVTDCLRKLVEKGVIRKESEPNRDGTLYKVLIPEEILSCREAMKVALARPVPVVNPLAVADYYNVRENRTAIFERDGYACQYCQKQLTRFTATLDHIVPVSAGGGNEYANVTTACPGCNSKKAGKPLGDFLADTNPT
ncbi:HNH endonuclease [Phenylobacterium sp.]|uniref:HNH endonuclease n=1 Tax=Phenylobacterium sp. TaxID=1871053 RepID=UPI002CE852BA|nr:HNH endonuclease [Phenylobacterium sp.]HLZ75367.1 HNH endonuclease [Phenylobacterium sp.]